MLKILSSGSGDMAYLVKCLSPKHENINLDTSTHAINIETFVEQRGELIVV